MLTRGRYADAIVKNFANSSVMAILIVISAYFFHLQTTVHSWLGIVIVLATTYCYMNIALRLPVPKPPEAHAPEQAEARAHLLEEAGGGTDAEGDGPSTSPRAKP